MIKKFRSFSILSLLPLLAFLAPSSAHGYPYSVQNAFCSDYGYNKARKGYSGDFNNNYQTNYNYCMKNANKLIAEEERRKKLYELELQESQRKWRIEAQAERLERERLRKAREREEQIKLQKEKDLINNANDLFR